MTSETTTTGNDYEAILTAECARLNAEALAALDLGLEGRYLKLTREANTLEALAIKHAEEAK